MSHLEPADRLDRLNSSSCHFPDGARTWIQREVGWLHASSVSGELHHDGVRAIDGANVPCQGKKIPPMTLRVKEAPQKLRLAVCDGRFEASEPALHRFPNTFGRISHCRLLALLAHRDWVDGLIVGRLPSRTRSKLIIAEGKGYFRVQPRVAPPQVSMRFTKSTAGA